MIVNDIDDDQIVWNYYFYEKHNLVLSVKLQENGVNHKLRYLQSEKCRYISRKMTLEQIKGSLTTIFFNAFPLKISWLEFFQYVISATLKLEFQKWKIQKFKTLTRVFILSDRWHSWPIKSSLFESQPIRSLILKHQFETDPSSNWYRLKLMKEVTWQRNSQVIIQNVPIFLN